jgi:DNA-binding CsgD family transcriptional regulator/PAS domain-containing protein
MPRVIDPPDKLLDLIYDAATDEALWTPALIQIADMTGSLGGFVVGVEIKDRLVPFLFNGRMREESHRTYAERHVENPWSTVMNHAPAGKLVQSAEIVPLPVLKRTAFFDEVLRPQGMAHNAMVMLARKENFVGAFNVCRSERQGPFQADELRLLSRIYPHVRRSLLLSFRLVGYKALQRAEFHVLDRLSVGIILLNRSGRVVFANAAGRAMTALDGPLRLRNSVATTSSSTHSKRLRDLVDAAVRGMPVGTMSLPHSDDGRLFTVLVSSVRGRDIDRFDGFGMRNAAAMLVIHDPARPIQIPSEWIMDAYGLTQAEARVALCAASGATIPETANRLNVSPNTVKTHLRRIFDKTGTSRQTELGRLMASIGLLRANSPDGNDRS